MIGVQGIKIRWYQGMCSFTDEEISSQKLRSTEYGGRVSFVVSY